MSLLFALSKQALESVQYITIDTFLSRFFVMSRKQR